MDNIINFSYIFPFSDLNDLEFLNLDNNYSVDLSYLNDKVFDQFYSEYDNYDINFDPSSNYFNELKPIFENCNYVFTDDQGFDVDQDSFSVCCLNINSIPCNFEQFIDQCIHPLNYSFDVLAFCETKLTDDIEHLYDLKNYNKTSLNNSRNSGGLILFTHTKYSDIRPRNDLGRKSRSIESLFVEFDIPGAEVGVVCGVIYHRPNSSTLEFLEELEIIIDRLNEENKKIYIMGDFNINLFNFYNSNNDNNNNNITANFINLMHSKNLYSLINKSTRVTDLSCTLIDNIWTNDYKNCTRNGIIYDRTSDHFPIFSCFKSKFYSKPHNDKIKISYRNFGDENINNFKYELSNVNWNLIFCTSDVNVAYDHFSLIFLALFNKHFPLIHKTVSQNHSNKPWITHDIRLKIKERNKLQRKYAKKPITYNNEYKSFRNKLNDEIRCAKSKYFNDRLKQNTNNPKNTWKIINDVLKTNKNKDNSNFKLIIDNETLTNPFEIATTFNNYFVNIGPSLSDKIVDRGIPPENYFGAGCHNSIVLQQISNDEIVSLVQGLSDGSAGYDGVPPKLIRKVIHEIKAPLLFIFNLSLSVGTFPNGLKQSRVTPLYKSESKSQPNNYRPISVLSIFSKIFEKLVTTRLELFFEENNIINSVQFGFQKYKSTTSAILKLSDYVLNSFDNQNFVISVFLDFKKAFDTVNHSILLKKLEHYGVRGVALDWFSSYLHCRTQHTKFMNSCSSNLPITHSIPQGSVLGPILFNIYINDLVNALDSLNIILFADDSCLYLSHKHLDFLINTVNEELVSVSNWLNANKLSLNLNKSHYMIFNRNRDLHENHPPITINNQPINKQNQTKFLGITLQSNLKWNIHISNITNKLNKYASIFYQVRNNFDQKHLVILYYSLAYSQLAYANIIWGHTYKTYLNSLFIAQKRIIRTILFRSKTHHTNQDFINLSILKLREINIYFSAIFVFKSLNNLTFPIDYFISHQVNYNLRNISDLVPSFSSSTQGQTSPKYYCSLIWNSLPPYIRNKPSVSSFKSALRLYLLNNYS